MGCSLNPASASGVEKPGTTLSTFIHPLGTCFPMGLWVSIFFMETLMNHLDCTPSLDDQAPDCDDVQLYFEEHACVAIVSKRLGFGCSTSNPDDHAHWLYQGKQYTIKAEKQREYAIHGKRAANPS